MKVLMFGWEYPPYNSGGLGVACLGLSTALASSNTHITFVLPKKVDIESDLVDFAFPTDHLNDNIDFHPIDSLLTPYVTEKSYLESFSSHLDSDVYGNDLFAEVARYALQGAAVAKLHEFDVIHAHDWLSFGAGITAKRESGKPLIAHIHATEFDRTGGNVNQHIYELEKAGFESADRIVAVSEFIKNTVITHYGISADKIEVVYNGIDMPSTELSDSTIETLERLKAAGYKLILFVGRLTIQKGPEYFLRAAARVLTEAPKTKFLMVGSGDMEAFLIEEAARLNIGDKVLFPGFVRGKSLQKIYSMADAFVMPSISEPFGLVALEAVAQNTPVIVTNQSGVAEVLEHVIKVDFWDEQAMANGILGVINHSHLYKPMTEFSYKQAASITWKKAADKINSIYKSILNK